jgi:hypothetical protein
MLGIFEQNTVRNSLTKKNGQLFLRAPGFLGDLGAKLSSCAQ